MASLRDGSFDSEETVTVPLPPTLLHPLSTDNYVRGAVTPPLPDEIYPSLPAAYEERRQSIVAVALHRQEKAKCSSGDMSTASPLNGTTRDTDVKPGLGRIEPYLNGAVQFRYRILIRASEIG